MGNKRAGRLHALTAVQVQQAADGEHSDGGGLQLRVQGARAQWVLRYTAPSGRRREMGLGVALRGSRAQAGESLSAARDLAHKARELLRQGIDPIEHRERQREAARAAEEAEKARRARERWTLARCARDYHSRVIEPTRSPKHAAQWISSLENHVPPSLWRAPIDSIEAPALLAALLEVRPHERARRHTGDSVPETVMRIRQRLDAIFEDSIFHGRASANPAAAIRRKMREFGPKREARGRFAALPFSEAPDLMRRVRALEGVAARALEFAVLTAARTSEVLLAQWDEFDLGAGAWVIPARRMKAREPHTVYLSPRAVEVLRAQAGQHQRWVFPSPMPRDGQARPLSNMGMLNVLDRLGVRGKTTVHGFCRSSFSTWANETAAARPDVIEACLAHKERDLVRSAYNRAEFAAERRALLEKWAVFLERPAAPVVAIAEARAA